VEDRLRFRRPVSLPPPPSLFIKRPTDGSPVVVGSSGVPCRPDGMASSAARDLDVVAVPLQSGDDEDDSAEEDEDIDRTDIEEDEDSKEGDG
jgi:hypothetical protein